MISSSGENEPGVQQVREGVWGNLGALAAFIKWLGAFIQLTEAEQEAAGIQLEHQRRE